MAIELKKSLERITSGRVPAHCGRDRGRAIRVRLMPGAVLLRAEGRRWSSGVSISWEEIYAIAIQQAAKEDKKTGRCR